MKKPCITFGSIVVVGILLSGCSDQSEVPSQKEVLAESVNEVMDERKAKTGPFSKYRTVKEYIEGIADRWEIEAETSEMKMEIVNDVLVYADYFQDEIAEMGIKSDFGELQLLAENVVEGEEGEYRFKTKLHEIIINMVEVKNYKDMRSWASDSAVLLSEPIDTNDDLGIAKRAKQVMSSFPQNVIEEKGLDSKEGEIQSKTILLASEILIQQRVAERPKDFEELWAKYDELKQYIEDVANEYQ